MNKSVSSGVIIAVIVVLVIVLAAWAYITSQPAGYTPSPGVAGRPAATIPNEGAPGQGKSKNSKYNQPMTPPAGSTPGMPPGYKQ